MKKLLFIITITGLVPFFSACENWFDVNPRSQVKNDVLFEDEKGFRTALFGIYTSMVQTSLYGSELTMSFLDVLAQYYTIDGTSNNYNSLSSYKYDESIAEGKTSSIWNGMYRTITNCNNLLENLEGKENLFTGKNHQLIRGEALGIRAYLHFDLLRMFAPSYAVGKSEPAIPYVDKVSRKPYPQLTSEQISARILEDCRAALADLEVSDPFGPAGEILNTDEDFLQYRDERMNYYAVKALMARVYLWCNNPQEAGKIAGELISSSNNPGVNAPLFSLYTDKLNDYSNVFFGEKTDGWNKLIVSQNQRENFYEASKYKSYDSRIQDWLALAPGSIEDSGNTGIFLVTRYINGSPKPTAITLIRMSEMYYIQAECRETAADALGDLNTVRHSYQIPASLDLTEANNIFEDELSKEYRKTFLAEGQFFYFLKRKDVTTIPGASAITNPRAVFCLPIPIEEQEFGNMIH